MSNRLVVRDTVRNVEAGFARVARAREAVASGKALQRPSDGPAATARAMALREVLAAGEQTAKNIDYQTNWLQSVDDQLAAAAETLTGVRTLLLQADNGTMNPADLQTFARQVDEAIEQLVATGNASFNGYYLFAGQDLTVRPLTRDPATGTVTYDAAPEAADGPWAVEPIREVGPALKINGKELFIDPPEEDPSVPGMFDLLLNIKNLLAGGQIDQAAELLPGLDRHLERVLQERGIVGSRLNRLEGLRNQIQTRTLRLTELLSKTEDADLAQTVLELKEYEVTYQATLAAASEVMQLGLLRYL